MDDNIKMRTLDEIRALRNKADAQESVEQTDEGFFKSLKNSFSDGMRSEVKKSIDPKHLDKYNIDSAKSVGDIKNILKKAKSAGHMKESVERVDELSIKTLSKYNDKASKDPKRAKGNNKAVGKIVKKTMRGESVEQVDEIVAKQNKNGEIEMTKAKYAKVHKDFKGKWPDGVHYVTQHQGRQGMTQVPVKFVKEEVEVEVDVTELWEADYKLQHNTFLGAIREAYTVAEQNGFTVDEDDWTNKIMHGPMKPSNGEINNYSIGLLENNKVVGNQLLIRVSNIGKTYELTAHVQ